MNDDLRMIAAYWSEKYAEALDDSTNDEELDWAKRPMIAVLGGQADAVGTADEFGTTEVENMAFLTGYLGYPCDAIYIAATMPAEILVRPSGDTAPRGLDDIEPAELRSGFITWAHCIPTRETAIVTFAPYIHDDGTTEWLKILDDGTADESEAHDDPAWEALVHAAHDFDGIPIEDDSQRDRALARSLIVADNGTGYEAEILEPNMILNAARAWAASQ